MILSNRYQVTYFKNIKSKKGESHWNIYKSCQKGTNKYAIKKNAPEKVGPNWVRPIDENNRWKLRGRHYRPSLIPTMQTIGMSYLWNKSTLKNLSSVENLLQSLKTAFSQGLHIGFMHDQIGYKNYIKRQKFSFLQTKKSNRRFL